MKIIIKFEIQKIFFNLQIVLEAINNFIFSNVKQEKLNTFWNKLILVTYPKLFSNSKIFYLFLKFFFKFLMPFDTNIYLTQ